MMSFQSNLSTASTIATNLSQSTQPIGQLPEISTDTATTLTGNEKAKEAIAKKNTLTSSFLSAMNQDIANIQSAAKDFEVMNDQIKQAIQFVPTLD